MEFKMWLWLLSSIGLGAAILLWHKRKSALGEQIGPSDSYSNFTLYFDPINGEGHLFIGGTLVSITTSLFIYEFVKTVINLLGFNK